MEAAAAGATGDDQVSLWLASERSEEETEGLGGGMEAPDLEGRGVEANDVSSTSTSAMSSSRPLSLSSAASGDPVTREWEELPCRALVREIFGNVLPPTSSSEDVIAASTGQPMSPRRRISRWLRWTRDRSNLQQREAPQLSPLTAPVSPILEPHNDVGFQPVSPERSQQTTEEFRNEAMDTLVEKVNRDLEAMGQAMEDEFEALLDLQPQLLAREVEIESTLKAFQEEKEGLEMKLRGILENADKLEEWGRQNGSCWTHDGGAVDVDTIFVPCDGLSSELLRCQSAYSAVDDVIRDLEKAVQEEALPFGLYLENVRTLATTQFFPSASMEMLKAVQKLLGREAEMDEEMEQRKRDVEHSDGPQMGAMPNVSV